MPIHQTHALRLRAAHLLLIIPAAATLAACSDRLPTASSAVGATRQPLAPAVSPTLQLRPSTQVTGSAIMTVITHGAAGAAARMATVDSGTFAGTLVRGRPLVVSLQFRAGTIPMEIAVDSVAPARQGQWERRSTTGRVIRRSATGGAPVSVTDFMERGQLQSRVSVTWRRVAGGWVAVERAVTLFSNGRPQQTVHIALDVRTLPPAAAALPAGGGTALVAADWLGGESDGDGEVEEPWGDYSAKCDREFEAMFAALDEYFIAAAAMTGCLLSPGSCLTATFGVIRAARKVDRAEKILDDCLARPTTEVRLDAR
jgi:hypothetical protein